jgi:hypothetical protein
VEGKGNMRWISDDRGIPRNVPAWMWAAFYPVFQSRQHAFHKKKPFYRDKSCIFLPTRKAQRKNLTANHIRNNLGKIVWRGGECVWEPFVGA